jgi:hypothetical protein
MTTVFEKNLQLQTIEKAAKRRVGINKVVLITALIFLFSGMLMSPLSILISPAVLLLIGGVAYTFFFGTTKEQRIAKAQTKLLQKAVKESLGAKDINAERVAALMKDYYELSKRVDYDADIRQRFTALCQSAGVANGGILMQDDRLL